MSYRNPILPGFHPDPSVCVVGDTFYVATSSFEYFPAVPIYASEDLVHWRRLGHALTRPSQLDLRVVEPSGGIFAPTLRYNKGRWYMTTCSCYKMAHRTPFERVPTARGMFVWTDDIESGEWSEPVYFDVTGIDEDLFFDDDGQVYLSYATHEAPNYLFTAPDKFNLSVYTAPIDIATGDLLAPAALVRHNRTTGNWVAEGSHIFRRGEWYYMITAEGGTEIAHQEWVGRSRSPMGPWEVPNAGPHDAIPGRSIPIEATVTVDGAERPVNPLVYNGDDAHVQMTGHMDIVEGPDGRWWAFCLGVRPQDGRLSQLGRETFLLPVEWADDWPVVNRGRKVALEGDASVGLQRVDPHQAWSYEWAPDMDLHAEGWYFLRTPQKAFASLTSHPGALAIKGGPYGLDIDENVTLVARKQTAFVGRWVVDFEANPAAGEAAGVAVWWSKWAHGALFLRGTEAGPGCQGGRELVFKMPVEAGGDGFEEHAVPFDGTRVRVTIDARPEGYTFSVEGKEVGVLSATRLVQTRAYDSIMTGTMLVLFAHGANHQGCIKPALFHGVSWEGPLE